MPSGARSLPACCTTPWRKPRPSAPASVIEALRDTMSELLGMDEPRKRIAAMMSGLDIHYDLGEGHPVGVVECQGRAG